MTSDDDPILPIINSDWRHAFGSEESPVVIAALDPRTVGICDAIRGLCSGRRQQIVAIGPPGSGKSLLVSALIAEASEARLPLRSVSPTTDAAGVLRDLARGEVGLLVVHRLDELTAGVRSAVLANRTRCSIGILATAEIVTAATLSALTDPDDLVAHLAPLEERAADVPAIAQVLWPGVCGAESDLIGNCNDDAVESLSRGPHPQGVTSLRGALAQLADALIADGSLQEGRFRRQVESRDIDDALFAVYRSQYSVPAATSPAAVIVVEGSTDAAYLTAAAQCAERAWRWQLLDGCEVRPSGDERSGGADAVWQRLTELRASIAESVGLFDNDQPGRRAYDRARDQALLVELLPAEFDRLRLYPEDRTVEIEDLLDSSILDRFFMEHPTIEPEEVRWRNGAWRIVPKGEDKGNVADWVSTAMEVEDCERIIYVLCVLRRRLGMAIPHDDLDLWRMDLARPRGESAPRMLTRLSAPRADAGGEDHSDAPPGPGG